MKRKKPLTEKEEEFYNKLIDYYIDHLKMPSREELASWMKMASPQLVQYYLSILKEKGWLVEDKYRTPFEKEEEQKDANQLG